MAIHQGAMVIHQGTMVIHHGDASGHHDIYLSLLFSGEVAVGMIFDMTLLSIGMVGYDQVSRLQHNYVHTYM